jgi:hypothetical protein
MTDKQPKALWLADELEKYTYDFEWHSTAADELRRLHEVNVQLVEALDDLAAWQDGEVGSHMDEPHAAFVARVALGYVRSKYEATGEQR